MIFQYSLCHYIAVLGFCFHAGNMKNYILILNTTVAQVSDQLITFFGIESTPFTLYCH